MQDVLARQPDRSAAAEEAPSLVNAIMRERWVVLACVVIAALLGIGLSTLQSPQYEASSTMFLNNKGDFDPLATAGSTQDIDRFLSNQVAQIEAESVLDAAKKELGEDSLSVQEFASRITVVQSETASVITVTATSGTDTGAAAAADAVVKAYRAVRAQQISDTVDSAVQQNSTGVAASTIRASAAAYGDGVTYVQAASVPAGKSSPQPIRNALILALVGLIAGTGYALYTQSFSRRKVGPAEASAIFGAPVLSEVPDRGRIGSDDSIAAAYSEPGDAYRMAAVGLDYIRGTAPGVFLITAPHDGAGSSLTALNLAAAAADHGRRVFLLNIEDTVRPQSQADSGISRVPLHDLAQGHIDLGHAVERKAASRAQFGVIRLQVLQPVQGHPVPDVQSILDQLPDDTDLVLIDAPPLPASSASFVLAGQVDAAVVVIDDVTTPADLEELQRRCRLAGIPVAGVLVNHIRRSSNLVTRRRQRAAMGSLPDRMYDTSPRGLPILSAPAGDQRDPAYSSSGGRGGYRDDAYNTGGQGYGGGQARGDSGELPWSAVTGGAPDDDPSSRRRHR
ncbi:Wzz/FepE/Etk N-terminal domain-containing protein [Kineosporia succinea]|uniref:Capsular polysaccharide biosynthesis protein/cellulose biosynthesis protein BcsQ n=1 Tax=Kineosporia succinea TaxID=84632 RepID=A0ABT9P0K9_9ACTN|nr:Wzz/FepE/Etk N-terminal domain-containing protein [Kineosporia succinea]MDP9825959.1 capsular polysaccharide biosynthesis protein/cellulose biosynthesis protein BcsQ [Kineosporia succinea]